MEVLKASWNWINDLLEEETGHKYFSQGNPYTYARPSFGDKTDKGVLLLCVTY